MRAFRRRKEKASAGSAHLALDYGARSDTTVRSELGAKIDMLYPLSRGNGLAVRTRLAWAHDQSNNPDIAAGLQTMLGGRFNVGGSASAANLILLSAGAELRLSNRVSIGARFDGEFSNGSRTYTGTGTVRYDW